MRALLPALATVMAMAMVSGGTARVCAVLLLIARRKNGLVLLDEVENGVFHTRVPDFCKAMLKLARDQGTQLVQQSRRNECSLAGSRRDARVDEDQRVHGLNDRVGDDRQQQPAAAVADEHDRLRERPQPPTNSLDTRSPLGWQPSARPG